MPFYCYRCGKTYTTKNRLDNHLFKTKELCKVKYFKLKPDDLVENYDSYHQKLHPEFIKLLEKNTKPVDGDKPKKKQKAAKFICKGCQQSFCRSYYYKHIKNECTQTLHNHSINIVGNNNNIITGNNNTQNYNNIVNIIHNFGQEDISSLTKKDIQTILKRKLDAIPELFTRTHIDIPENRNIFLKNIKDTHALYYQNGKWNYMSVNSLTHEILSLQTDRLCEYLTEHKVSSKLRHYYDKYFDDLPDNNSLLSNYKNIIKEKLVNDRDLIKETYESFVGQKVKLNMLPKTLDTGFDSKN